MEGEAQQSLENDVKGSSTLLARHSPLFFTTLRNNFEA